MNATSKHPLVFQFQERLIFLLCLFFSFRSNLDFDGFDDFQPILGSHSHKLPRRAYAYTVRSPTITIKTRQP